MSPLISPLHVLIIYISFYYTQVVRQRTNGTEERICASRSMIQRTDVVFVVSVSRGIKRDVSQGWSSKLKAPDERVDRHGRTVSSSQAFIQQAENASFCFVPKKRALAFFKLELRSLNALLTPGDCFR